MFQVLVAAIVCRGTEQAGYCSSQRLPITITAGGESDEVLHSTRHKSTEQGAQHGDDRSCHKIPLLLSSFRISGRVLRPKPVLPN